MESTNVTFIDSTVSENITNVTAKVAASCFTDVNILESIMCYFKDEEFINNLPYAVAGFMTSSLIFLIACLLCKYKEKRKENRNVKADRRKDSTSSSPTMPKMSYTYASVKRDDKNNGKMKVERPAIGIVSGAYGEVIDDHKYLPSAKLENETNDDTETKDDGHLSCQKYPSPVSKENKMSYAYTTVQKVKTNNKPKDEETEQVNKVGDNEQTTKSDNEMQDGKTFVIYDMVDESDNQTAEIPNNQFVQTEENPNEDTYETFTIDELNSEPIPINNGNQTGIDKNCITSDIQEKGDSSSLDQNNENITDAKLEPMDKNDESNLSDTSESKKSDGFLAPSFTTNFEDQSLGESVKDLKDEENSKDEASCQRNSCNKDMLETCIEMSELDTNHQRAEDACVKYNTDEQQHENEHKNQQNESKPPKHPFLIFDSLEKEQKFTTQEKRKSNELLENTDESFNDSWDLMTSFTAINKCYDLYTLET